MACLRTWNTIDSEDIGRVKVKAERSAKGQIMQNHAEHMLGHKALGATMDSLAFLATSFLPEMPSAFRTISSVHYGVCLTNDHLSPFFFFFFVEGGSNAQLEKLPFSSFLYQQGYAWLNASCNWHWCVQPGHAMKIKKSEGLLRSGSLL